MVERADWTGETPECCRPKRLGGPGLTPCGPKAEEHEKLITSSWKRPNSWGLGVAGTPRTGAPRQGATTTGQAATPRATTVTVALARAARAANSFRRDLTHGSPAPRPSAAAPPSRCARWFTHSLEAPAGRGVGFWLGAPLNARCRAARAVRQRRCSVSRHDRERSKEPHGFPSWTSSATNSLPARTGRGPNRTPGEENTTPLPVTYLSLSVANCAVCDSV